MSRQTRRAVRMASWLVAAVVVGVALAWILQALWFVSLNLWGRWL